jgi:hypothetical protein
LDPGKLKAFAGDPAKLTRRLVHVAPQIHKHLTGAAHVD